MADQEPLEDDPDDEEDNDEIIRAKWIMDGAKTLPEAAAMVREFANYLDSLTAEGYELRAEVNDDYGFIYKPDVA
jgi:hypothetical protein